LCTDDFPARLGRATSRLHRHRREQPQDSLRSGLDVPWRASSSGSCVVIPTGQRPVWTVMAGAGCGPRAPRSPPRSGGEFTAQADQPRGGRSSRSPAPRASALADVGPPKRIAAGGDELDLGRPIPQSSSARRAAGIAEISGHARVVEQAARARRPSRPSMPSSTIHVSTGLGRHPRRQNRGRVAPSLMEDRDPVISRLAELPRS